MRLRRDGYSAGLDVEDSESLCLLAWLLPHAGYMNVDGCDAAPSRAYVVRSVLGRGSGGRGLPPINDLVLEGPHGTMQISRVTDMGEPCGAVVLATAGHHEFPICPLCCSPLTRATKEHVPQADLGGQGMTATCARCNNSLGSRVEPELRDWFDDAVGNVRLRGAAVRGRRKSSRLLLRRTGSHFVLIPEYPLHPDLEPLFTSGKFEIEYRIPDRAIWSLAALKHAYLGACLLLQRIPDSPLAQRVRHDLLAVRDARARDALPESAVAQSLRIARSMRRASGPAISLVALIRPDGTMADAGLSFAGTLFVSWPLEVDLLGEAVAIATSSPDGRTE